MNYIILDLEWDSVYYKPEKRFLNQILQIGAVKLDQNFNTVNTFSATIRSSISNRVTGRFAKLTGITNEVMRAGIPFEDAVKAYNDFVGDAEYTMTWSNSDLYTILANQDYLLKDLEFKIKGYVDLQKLVQGHLYTKGYEDKNQISLEAAAEFLKVDTGEFQLHTALDDALLSAHLLKICYDKKRFEGLVKDLSQPDYIERIRFKPYNISNINDSLIKPQQLEFTCPKCKGKTKRLNNWKYRNRWFVCNFKCEDCGFKFNGRVTFKKTYDDLKVKHKVCEYKPKVKKTNDVQPVPEKV